LRGSCNHGRGSTRNGSHEDGSAIGTALRHNCTGTLIALGHGQPILWALSTSKCSRGDYSC
jgi:hypothetical protein